MRTYTLSKQDSAIINRLRPISGRLWDVFDHNVIICEYFRSPPLKKTFKQVTYYVNKQYLDTVRLWRYLPDIT